VLVNPTANAGAAPLRLEAQGNPGDFDYREVCDVSKSNISYTLAGAGGYDATCVVSNANLANYPGGFKLYVYANVTWPSYSTQYSTTFHVDP
jgi:hypothetical protein